MWLWAHITMQRRGRDQVAGEHKAVLELANAMQTQTKGDEGNAAELTESELQHRIAEDRGGAISYEASLLSAGDGDRGWVVAQYLKREKWWLAVLVASCAGSITIGVVGLLPYNCHRGAIGGSHSLHQRRDDTEEQRDYFVVVFLGIVRRASDHCDSCAGVHNIGRRWVFEIWNVGWL
tara:strand:- start:11748 stop:12281 length:534 start_codon:yes stop_codon:yes gene_type:complete